jgi:hypothetical protein
MLLKQHLPRTACLVGQNIGKDVMWLGLKEGVDFASLVDLAGLFRVFNAKYKSFTYFGLDHVATVLLGEANAGAAHNAVTDAIKSIRLFLLWVFLQVTRNPSPAMVSGVGEDRVGRFEGEGLYHLPGEPTSAKLREGAWCALLHTRADATHTGRRGSLQSQPVQLAAAQESLLNSKLTPSFASQNPTFEGCCMGNRKTCKCGDPFLG